MLRIAVSVLSLAALCASAALAQPYPNRPVRLLTAGAGGGSDIASRVVAQGLAARLGQPVVVDSRVGGVIIADIAAKAAPDGYTLVIYSSGLWLIPLMQEKPTYDALRDFSPIALVGGSPMVLIVHPAVAAKSVQELIALAKSKPGQLSSATGPLGATPHLSLELFKSMAGVDILTVAYRNVAAGVTDVLGGRVQMMFPNTGAVMGHIKSGKLRGLGVGTLKSSALAPGLPTISESGLPGFEAVSAYGLFGPARMPQALVARLNKETVAVLDAAETRDRMVAAGVEPIGSTPEGLRAQMSADVAKFGKVIKAAKIRID